MKKFVIMSGYITSITDRDTHLISCQQLVRLYGLEGRLSECILVPYGKDNWSRGLTQEQLKRLKFLHPCALEIGYTRVRKDLESEKSS